MSNRSHFHGLFNAFKNLSVDSASPRAKRRLRLGVETMKDRTMPTAVPLTSPDGGSWVKIDSISVATKTNQSATSGVSSSVILEAGKTYMAVAHGTGRISWIDEGLADAEYIMLTRTTGPQDGSTPGYPWTNHGVRLAGVAGGETSGNLWGAYQSDNQYVKNFVGQGTKVTGYYTDIPVAYADNDGAISVDIYANVPSVIKSTTTSLSSSASTAVYGQSVALTANVSATSLALGSLTGTVTIYDADTVLGVGTLSCGSASLTLKLNAGSHALTAVYGGSPLWSGSSSGLTQTITPAPSLSWLTTRRKNTGPICQH